MPPSLRGGLAELYTLRKLEYHRIVPDGPYAQPLCTKRDFQARSIGPLRWDDPVATVLPKAMGISWPSASWVEYILSRLGLVRSIARSFPLTFIIRGGGGCLPRDRGQLDLAHHLLGQFRLLGPLPLGPLGFEHGKLW